MSNKTLIRPIPVFQQKSVVRSLYVSIYFVFGFFRVLVGLNGIDRLCDTLYSEIVHLNSVHIFGVLFFFFLLSSVSATTLNIIHIYQRARKCASEAKDDQQKKRDNVSLSKRKEDEIKKSLNQHIRKIVSDI